MNQCERDISSIFVWVLLLVVTTAAPAAAQLTTGTIAGTVIDQTKSSLPGTTVAIKNVETGLTRSVRHERPRLL